MPLSPLVLVPDSERNGRKRSEAVKQPGGRLFFNQVGLRLTDPSALQGLGQNTFLCVTSPDAWLRPLDPRVEP